MRSQSPMEIFLIPGGPGMGSDYMQESAHRKHGFRCHAIDFNHRGLKSILDMANYAEDFVASKGCENVVLIGHSFGGALAIEIAMRGRLPIKQLILTNWIYDSRWSENYYQHHHGNFENTPTPDRAYDDFA